MGQAFPTPAVHGPDGWPLSGATFGSADHYARAVGLLHRNPDAALDALCLALRLSPAFVMARVAMAYLLAWDEPAMGRATVRGLMPHDRTAREASHLAMLSAAGPGGPDAAALRAHLDTWPDDILARALQAQSAARAA